ncbi:uncharacterized protein LOC119668716 [Teleopsis dalmanni]|uniref:uncharacterized protein LOC119668716 n=1 Tax=Teleopsis dalmanni TaxID=139649 RepID=UPI0018CDFD55|nr:uncharacterized protein LOC119668716 [Teleopsis dalmanni]
MFQAILITALLCTVSGKVLSEEEQMKVTKVQVTLNTPEMSSVEVPAEVVEVVNDQKLSTNTVGVIPVEVMKENKEMGTSSKMPVMPVGVVPMPTVSNTVGVIPVEIMKEKKEMESANKMPVMPVGVVPMSTVVTKMPKVVVGPSMQMPMNTPTDMDVAKSSDPCDLQCTKLDLNPVCASSDLCIYEFPNKCVMDTYNCKHPEMNFKETKDERCKMYWLKHCTEKDLMG